jgi:AraC family transcriptional regulator, glycine betaine-responsive activator
VRRAITRPILTWLRRESRRGIAIGGVCTGVQALAEAGLLDGRRCTIHWENRDSFEEEFPDADLSENIFVIDQNRYTASGGTASIDLMLNLIARSHGSDLANLVADQLIHTSLRSGKEEQRLSIPTRIGVRHPKLASIVQRMEDNLEEPVSPSVLAQDADLSTRQLERLFRRYLHRSPKRYYMELRLQKARNLLLQTDMSVINVALACGFTSPSHFSKCYRALFETTPYRERGSTTERVTV